MERFFGMRWWRVLGRVACVGIAALAVGCASPRATWDPRIGVYSHDQALVDLGPPDKEAKTSDGSTVSEWLVHRGNDGRFVTYHGPYGGPYGYRRPYYGAGWASYHDVSTPDFWLRLTFGPEGTLRAWKELRK